MILNKLPPEIGPYVHSRYANNLLFVSGQIPIDPKTGNLVEGGIEEQTIQVLNNLEAVLLEKNLSLDHVVKTEVFLRDIKNFSIINDLYAAKFRDKQHSVW